MKSIFINGKEFKQIKVNDNYYISAYGDAFSQHSKTVIKHSMRPVGNKLYPYVNIKVNGKAKKMAIHKLVFETWVRALKEGEQVNHKDDNSLNNHYSNLYAGTQKENIQDCFNNSHRVGNVFYLTLLDKEINQIISFCPASEFIEYSGHSNKSKSLNKFFSKNWFKKRYEIIEFRRLKNIDEYNELKGVTTIGDECSQVG